MGAGTWYGRVNEDGSFAILARVPALEGSGDLILSEEGYCVTQADVASITCKVLSLGADRDNPAGVEVTPAPTLTPAANIYDTLRTVGWPTRHDQAGYNFRHDLGPTYVPNPNEWYQVEYRFVLSGGGIVWLRVKVKTIAVQTS